MNIFCYPHHISDFRRKTADLTHEQAGVYRALLDEYYFTGGNLTSDLDLLARIISVQTPSERSALAYAVARFFTVKGDKICQRRGAEEIEKIRSKSIKAKASAKSKHLNRNGNRASVRRPNADANAHANGDANAVLTKNQEPIVNSSNELFNQGAKSKKFDVAKIDLPEWLAQTAWKDWADHRRALKKPLTERSAALCIAELEKFRSQGHDPVQIINTSIMRGWQGLFEPKPDRPANGGNGHAKPTYSDGIQAAMRGAMQNMKEIDPDDNEIPF